MSACVYLRNYYVRVCIFKNVEGTGVYIYISKNSRCVYCTSGVYIKESKNWVTVKQTANVKTCIFNLFSQKTNIGSNIKTFNGKKLT